MIILGTHPETGKVISDSRESLMQSIQTILTTPIGTRVLRRDFGCNVFYLLDQPANALTKVKIQAAVADALQKYEPRIRFTAIRVYSIKSGHFILDIEGYRVTNNQYLKLININI